MVYCSCSESFLTALYRALSHKQLTFLVSGTLEGDKSSESQWCGVEAYNISILKSEVTQRDSTLSRELIGGPVVIRTLNEMNPRSAYKPRGHFFSTPTLYQGFIEMKLLQNV